jgi:hypothetical protein
MRTFRNAQLSNCPFDIGILFLGEIGLLSAQELPGGGGGKEVHAYFSALEIRNFRSGNFNFTAKMTRSQTTSVLPVIDR